MTKNAAHFLDKERLKAQEQLLEDEHQVAQKEASHKAPKAKKRFVDHKRGGSLAKQPRSSPRNALINPNPDEQTLEELAKIRKTPLKKE